MLLNYCHVYFLQLSVWDMRKIIEELYIYFNNLNIGLNVCLVSLI